MNYHTLVQQTAHRSVMISIPNDIAKMIGNYCLPKVFEIKYYHQYKQIKKRFVTHDVKKISKYLFENRHNSSFEWIKHLISFKYSLYSCFYKLEYDISNNALESILGNFIVFENFIEFCVKDLNIDNDKDIVYL